MTHLDAVCSYTKLFNLIGKYGGIAGVNMTKPNYRPSLVTWIWVGMNGSYIASALFTIITYDIDTKWMCANVLGISVQGIVKYIVLMSNHKRIYEKVYFLGKVYQSNTLATSANFHTLKLWSERGNVFARYGSLPLLITSLLFIIYGVGITIWTGERELILHFMLPFIDPKDSIGFLVLSVYHVAGLILATCGTCGADFMLVVLVFHLWPLSDILDNMCAELNAVLVMGSDRSGPEIRQFYYNILKMHKDICMYLEDISAVYFYMVFVEIYTCALTLCTLLYCMFTFTYFPNYMMAALFFFTMFLYCILGTVAELAMDRVYQTLVNTKWYLLPLPEQMCMKMVYAKAQKPTIMMAGTLPLNMDTFVEVMKTVYSVGMLLLKSTE